MTVRPVHADATVLGAFVISPDRQTGVFYTTVLPPGGRAEIEDIIHAAADPGSLPA